MNYVDYNTALMHLPSRIRVTDVTPNGGTLRWDIFDAENKHLGWIMSPVIGNAIRHIWRDPDMLDWHHIRGGLGQRFLNPCPFVERRRQFWRWGHNLAVMGVSEEDITGILDDNRFTVYARHRLEFASLMEGFDTRPLQWDRKHLATIGLRPILWQESTTQELISAKQTAAIHHSWRD